MLETDGNMIDPLAVVAVTRIHRDLSSWTSATCWFDVFVAGHRTPIRIERTKSTDSGIAQRNAVGRMAPELSAIRDTLLAGISEARCGTLPLSVAV